MALNKTEVVDKIEVLENGTIQVRCATRIDEDGTVLSSSFHRHVLSPGDDLTDQDPKVVAIATATWTAEVISAYEAKMAEQEADMNTGE
jgi:DNA-binding transcriptional regulator LsrR (DeoR family)